MLILALATAYAAFCIWLTVRIVNRRERWAKWLLAILIGLPTFYVVSVGPACWISSRTQSGDSMVSTIYGPLELVCSEFSFTKKAFNWYSQIAAAKDWEWFLERWQDFGTDGSDQWLLSPKARAIDRALDVD